MNRLILTAFFLLNWVTNFAQIADYPRQEVALGIQSKAMSAACDIHSENDLLGLFYSTFPWLNKQENELRIVHQIQSPVGTHYMIQQYYKGLPCYYQGIRVNLENNGKQFHAFEYLKPIPIDFDTAGIDGILNLYGELTGVKRLLQQKNGEHLETFLSKDDHLLYAHDLKRYISKDTTARGKVFMPNPVQSARTIYGAPYINASDADVPVIIAEQKTGHFRCRLKNDTFRLEERFLSFGEVSGPYTVPAWSRSDSFMFNRSHDFFEDINSYYHLTKEMDYLAALGFGNLRDRIVIDAHAYNGGDNSAFDPAVYPYTLEFGTGGVEDAEDGQVVVHEYGHAMSQFASPDTRTGSERSGMEEGNSDYIGISYTRSYNDHHWYKVFSWDGHNEFWNGFVSNSAKKYPTDIQNNTNNDREIWSTPLMCIYEALGKRVSDSLIFTHLYYQGPNTTMPQMARAILRVDTLLWKGVHAGKILNCFVERGILSFSATIADHVQSQIQVNNSMEWAQGQGALNIVLPDQNVFHLEIFQPNGQLYYENRIESNHFELEPNSFLPGVYILRLTNSQNQMATFKLIRYQ